MSSSEHDDANAAIHTDPFEGCQIQLIEVVDIDDNFNNRQPLKLNRKNLDIVLNSTKGHPVVVISVVGPRCTGKSRLLNFIVHGVKALEMKTKVNVKKSSKFVNENTLSYTNGIWAWNRAFIIEDTGNDKVAIILLDTHGLDETRSSLAILGLSFLSSSVTIYNVNSSEASNTFSPLNIYFKFGIQCNENREDLFEDENPFQNLFFLFREWNRPDDYSYGERGGKLFLKDQIRSLGLRQRKQTERGLQCFDQVFSFLLPPTSSRSFAQSLRDSNEELDDEFATKLQRFLCRLLKVENLTTKKKFGIELTSDELKDFLREYVDFFNMTLVENVRVDENLLWSSTCEAMYNCILKRSIAKYNYVFNKLTDTDLECQSKNMLQHIHENAHKQAISTFKIIGKLGEFQHLYLKKLHKDLDKAFKLKLSAATTNRSISEDAEHLVEIEIKSYSKMLQAKADNIGVSTLAELSKLHDQEVWHILNRFDDNCSLSPYSPRRGSLKTKLQKSLEVVYERDVCDIWASKQMERSLQKPTQKPRAVVKPNIKLSSCITTEKFMNDIIKSYEEKMRKVTEICTDVRDLRKAHEQNKTLILRSMQEKSEGCDEDLKELYEKMLSKNLEPMYQELEDMVKMQLKLEILDVSELKEHARVQYHEQMDKKKPLNKSIPPENLTKFHKETVDYIINDLNPLTGTQKKMIHETLDNSFVKYKDINTMQINSAIEAEPAIGIDLGTTYCCVAVFINDKIKIIPNSQGESTTPSYVTIHKDGSHVVGSNAKEASFRHAENTVFIAKRLIGRRFDDAHVQSDLKFWPFTVTEKDEMPSIEVFKKCYRPEQISSIILKQLVTDAEKFLQKPVTRAVITVPAYFTDGQREATVKAGEHAGLEVLTILNEPTAAAIAYKLERFHEDAKTVLVFDLGGGTLDVALLKVDVNNIEILHVAGDTHLGGEDFDKAVMEYCAEKFKSKHKINAFKYKETDTKLQKDEINRRRRRLQTHCEKGKKELSFAPFATICIDALVDGKDLEVKISREKFEELNAPLFKKAMNIVDQAIRSSNVSTDQIQDIVLVGGSTRIPKVQQMLQKLFNNQPLSCKINADEAVAYGAAVQAALLNGKNFLKLSLIQDVTPMSIGIAAYVNKKAGQFSPIVKKSTKIPVVTKGIYNTYKDNQKSLLLRVYQGEEPEVKNNEFLGEFLVKGVPPAPAGEHKIQVSMEVNKMGILHVTAVLEGQNGAKIPLVVGENKGGLTEAARKEFVNEAEEMPALSGNSYTTSSKRTKGRFSLLKKGI